MDHFKCTRIVLLVKQEDDNPCMNDICSWEVKDITILRPVCRSQYRHSVIVVMSCDWVLLGNDIRFHALYLPILHKPDSCDCNHEHTIKA